MAGSMMRTRWAAVGAAVAVALGAGGIGYVGASIGDGERTVFVPVEPCRILDTRPDFTVGPKTTPIGPGETHSVKGVGTVGECDLPNDATGLVLNATAIDASEPTFLTLFAAGVERPNASHLNPLPGQGPSPNAVTTDLGTDDRFSIYNRFGSVHFFADVVGYYADHHHDDRYYTKQQTYSRAQTYNRDEVAAAIAGPPVDRMVIPVADFQSDDDLLLSIAWNGDSSQPTPQCLGASPELPSGRTAESIDLYYRSPGGNTTIATGLFAVPLATGEPTVQALLVQSEAAAPMTPAGEFGRLTIAHDPPDVVPPFVFDPVVPPPEFTSSLRLCFQTDDWVLLGVALNFA